MTEQVYKKDISFWRATTKRPYNNDLWASVTQIDGKAKVSIPATSNIVNRSNGKAAYLKAPFYFLPTIQDILPPISQATRIFKDYADEDGVESPLVATLYSASSLSILSDSNPSTPPTLEAGDIVIVQDSQNQGGLITLDTEDDPTTVGSDKPSIGAFGQSYLGRKTYSNQRDLWILSGNDDIGSFSPKNTHYYISVTKETNNTLTIESTEYTNLGNLWPTCQVLESEVGLDQLIYTGGMTDWSTL